VRDLIDVIDKKVTKIVEFQITKYP